MSELSGLKDQLVETYHGLLTSIIEALPGVLTGIVLIVLSLVAAKVIQRVLAAVLRRIGLDAGVKRVGLDHTLGKLGIGKPLSALIPQVVYVLLLFLFAQTAAEALGLQPVTDAIGGFLAFMPNLLAAILLLVGGSLAGQFVEAAVSRAAKGAGIDYAGTIGSLVSVLVMFIAGIMALTQLKLHTDIIRIVTLCALGALAGAFAISFGLGTRDITRSIVSGFYARKLFRVGEQMELRGERGVLKAITPTQTVLERDGATITVSNSAYIDEVVRQ